MYTTKVIENFSKKELEKGVTDKASWHQEFKNSAYIFAGGLNYEMNEGDLCTVFAQYGELVDVRLIRDKKTGKSKGYGFLAYEDQRSTNLAVDNLNGADICERTIRVNHVKNFKPPKEFLEVKEGEEDEDDEDDENKIYKPSGPDGRGWGEYREYTQEELKAIEIEEKRLEMREQQTGELLDKLQERKQQLIIDEDERWERHLMQLMQEDDELLKEQEEFKKGLQEKINAKKEERKRKKEKKKLKKEKKKKEKKEKKEKKKQKKEKNKKKEKDRGDDDDLELDLEAEMKDIEQLEKELDREEERRGGKNTLPLRSLKRGGSRSSSNSSDSSSEDPRDRRRRSDSGSDSDD